MAGNSEDLLVEIATNLAEAVRELTRIREVLEAQERRQRRAEKSAKAPE